MRTKASAIVRPRTVASVASVGALVGLSFFAAAAPANAVTSADCLAGNTVNANAVTPGTVADIQSLLDASAPLICLIGNFAVPSSLVATSDVTFYGDPSATLTATGADRLIDSNDSVTVQNLTLSGGSVGDSGGAIASGNTVTAIHSTFENNTATGTGGAIYAYSVVDSESSTFIDNHAGGGGAIYDDFTGVTVRNSTFSDNTSTDQGGAVLALGTMIIDSSTFDGNTAVTGGAAAQDYYGGSTITNSTFTRNDSSAPGDVGGAVVTWGGTITQSTFLDNSLTDATGDHAVTTWDAPVVLLGNILANSIQNEPQLDVNSGGSIIDSGGNVLSTTKTVETVLTTPAASSMFGKSVASIFPSTSLGHHGGPTETLAIGAESAARGVVTSGTLSVDQRGKHRKSPADAGAFEYTTPASAGPSLPITGTDPSWPAGIAVALIAAGALAFGAGRRRRAARS